MSSNDLSKGYSLNTIRNKITPECINLGKSLKLTGALVLVVSILAMICIIVALVYSQMKSKDKKVNAAGDEEPTDDDEDKKKKVTLWMLIGTLILTIAASIMGIWNWAIASKAAKTCISKDI